jgi:hypothetical protein
MSEDILGKWIKNPAALRKALTLALIPSQDTPELKVWRTIKLGVGPTDAAAFLHLLEDVKLKISSMAKDMMAKPEFTFSAEKRDVDLVIVTTADLGFKTGVRRSRIYQRAKKLGLELCPPDVGPQLRLQYWNQPRGEWLRIGMKPIADSLGDSCVFGVENGFHGMLLGGHWSDPNSLWGPHDLWVFVRPCK